MAGAAVNIQKMFRSGRCVRSYHRQKRAALRLQSYTRMHTARAAFGEMLRKARERATYEGQIAEAKARLDAQVATRPHPPLTARWASIRKRRTAAPLALPVLLRTARLARARRTRVDSRGRNRRPRRHPTLRLGLLPLAPATASPVPQADEKLTLEEDKKRLEQALKGAITPEQMQAEMRRQQQEHSAELSRMLQQQQEELLALRDELQQTKIALRSEQDDRKAAEGKAEQAALQLSVERSNHQKLQRKYDLERSANVAAKGTFSGLCQP